MRAAGDSGGRPASEAAPTADPKTTNAGLSAFLGRVLEQLSLSSWLPAAMLVANAAVLITMGTQDTLDFKAAVGALTEDALGLLVVLAFALVLATIVTQAFEFDVIRLLEGYADSGWRPLRALATARIRRHAAKRARLIRRLRDREGEAFMSARRSMLDLPTPVDRRYLDVLEDEIFRRRSPAEVEPDVRADALALDWTQYVAPASLHRIDGLDARAGSYPLPHRVLPTRLGNVLRSFEDKVPLGPGENLEGFVLRHNDDMPATLQAEHRDFRTRLDMYCSLALVFTALALLAVAVIGPRAPWWVTVMVGCAYSALVLVSYEAAVSSARGYGTVLLEMAGHAARGAEERKTAMATPPSSGPRRLLAFLHRQ